MISVTGWKYATNYGQVLVYGFILFCFFSLFCFFFFIFFLFFFFFFLMTLYTCSRELCFYFLIPLLLFFLFSKLSWIPWLLYGLRDIRNENYNLLWKHLADKIICMLFFDGFFLYCFSDSFLLEWTAAGKWYFVIFDFSWNH